MIKARSVLECSFRNLEPHIVILQNHFCLQIVLVTGSGRGIGRSLALQFADLGATVVLFDINEV